MRARKEWMDNNLKRRTGSSIETKISPRQSDFGRPIENPPILSTSTVAIVSTRINYHVHVREKAVILGLIQGDDELG